MLDDLIVYHLLPCPPSHQSDGVSPEKTLVCDGVESNVDGIAIDLPLSEEQIRALFKIATGK